ncbi:hypothetical protein HY375_00300 [Candidatus Berkelbacteria bacterium]|nr:hypothetical protein [Candidatus Berkelbacteria bacterium]
MRRVLLIATSEALVQRVREVHRRWGLGNQVDISEPWKAGRVGPTDVLELLKTPEGGFAVALLEKTLSMQLIAALKDRWRTVFLDTETSEPDIVSRLMGQTAREVRTELALPRLLRVEVPLSSQQRRALRVLAKRPAWRTLTLRQLAAGWGELELLSIKGIGPASQEALKQLLHEHGLEPGPRR